jgi:hypothetical protein
MARNPGEAQLLWWLSWQIGCIGAKRSVRCTSLKIDG